MKAKQLIPLLVVLAVLAGLVFLKQSQDKPVSITEQVGLKPLVPDSVTADAITRVEAFAGENPDEKLVLAKTDKGWRVESYFNAPAKQVGIDALLGTLVGMQGEFRAEVGEDAYENYAIGEEKSFHVIGYAGSDTPAFHVLTGKAPTFGNSFVRSADSGAIYVANFDLRRECGIYTMKSEDPPEADRWLDKKVVAVESDGVKRIAVHYPDKDLVLEKQTRTVEKAPAELQAAEAPGEAIETDAEADAEGDAEPTEPETEEVTEWVVATGGLGEDLIDQPITSMLNRLVNLNAANIVDPAKVDEYKLNAPAYRLELTVDGEDAPVVIEASRSDDGSLSYARVAGREETVIYEMRSYDFDQLFPSGDAFFELPGILLDDGILSRIEYDSDAGKVVLTRPGGVWAIDQPKTDFPANAEALNAVERVLASFKPADYADSAEGTGLDNPAQTVTFSGVGKTHTIALGGKATHADGRYARLDDDPHVWVMSQSNVGTAFANPDDLLSRMIVSLEDDEEIDRIEVMRGDDTFTLALENELWQVMHADTTGEADEFQADDLASALAGLEATGFNFDDARAPGGILGTVSFTTTKDRSFSMTFEEAIEDEHVVTLSGRQTPFLAAKSVVDRIFKDPADLMPASEEESPEAESIPEAVETPTAEANPGQ